VRWIRLFVSHSLTRFLNLFLNVYSTMDLFSCIRRQRKICPQSDLHPNWNVCAMKQSDAMDANGFLNPSNPSMDSIAQFGSEADTKLGLEPIGLVELQRGDGIDQAVLDALHSAGARVVPLFFDEPLPLDIGVFLICGPFQPLTPFLHKLVRSIPSRSAPPPPSRRMVYGTNAIPKDS
jgi:hypothetical protein